MLLLPYFTFLIFSSSLSLSLPLSAIFQFHATSANDAWEFCGASTSSSHRKLRYGAALPQTIHNSPLEGHSLSLVWAWATTATTTTELCLSRGHSYSCNNWRGTRQQYRVVAASLRLPRRLLPRCGARLNSQVSHIAISSTTLCLFHSFPLSLSYLKQTVSIFSINMLQVGDVWKNVA